MRNSDHPDNPLPSAKAKERSEDLRYQNHGAADCAEIPRRCRDILCDSWVLAAPADRAGEVAPGSISAGLWASVVAWAVPVSAAPPGSGGKSRRSGEHSGYTS